MTESTIEQKKAHGAPFLNVNAKKSGHFARKRALLQLGFDAIDKRTSAGRAFAERREQIVADLGGSDALTQLQQDLVEKYLRSVVLIDSLDNWLFSQKSIINKRKRSVYPVVRERAALVDGALRLAQALGLERRATPVQDLKAYLSEQSA